MKKLAKIAACVLAVIMLITCGVSAGSYDDAFANLKLADFASYAGALGINQLRAFAVDPNGKYFYGGFLNGGTPTVFQFKAEDGKAGTSYTFAEDNGAYIKALGADDRGYVYMGIANKANNGAVYFAICEENGLKEIKWVKIDIEGKIGVNGTYVLKDGSKYYLYLVTNYDTDRIYRYDVTDVNNPTLDTSFGTNAGYSDLTAFKITDANNVSVGPDGSIYIAANTGAGSKGDSMIKLDAKATKVLATASVKEAYGSCIVGEYVATCTYNKGESEVVILDQADLSIIKSVTYPTASNFTQLGFIGDKLYIADQSPEAVVVTNSIKIPAPVVETPADIGESATTGDGFIAAMALMVAAGAAIVFTSKKRG